MAKRLGHTIDHYHIITHIGEDRWGDIFDAYDAELDKNVVLHTILRDLLPQRSSEDYILRANRKIMKWDHPGIAQIIDIGENERYFYIVREKVPGVQLGWLLQKLQERGKWISLSDSVTILLQILSSLEVSHRNGVIHGNLVPDNLMLIPVDEEKQAVQVVLLNLGFVDPEHPGKDERTIYHPPEQLSGEKIDQRADLYACGVLLSELVTSQPPSPTGGAHSPKPPHVQRPDLPISLERIILQAMNTKPEDRFLDSNDMALALSEILPEVSLVTTPPPHLKEITNLYQALKNLTHKSGGTHPNPEESDFDKPVKPAELPQDVRSDRDTIHILMPDQSMRSEPIESALINIGRGSDNQLVIEHSTVSRNHARLEFNGHDYLVQDLNSLNGTFLGEERLQPDKTHVWNPGENLRLGEVWLRLECTGQALSTVAKVPEDTELMEFTPIPAIDEIIRRSDGTPIDATQIKFSPSKRWGVYAGTSNISVTPGKPATTSILLFNRSKEADILRLTFVGVPLEWLPNRPQSINLPSGGQREVELIFKPPRNTGSRAGRHTVTLRISSEREPDQMVEVRLGLNIAAFSQFSSEMQPRRVLQGSKGKISIQNQGNLPEKISVIWDDKLRELSFDPPKANISVAPGETGVLHFQPSLTKPRLIGGEKQHSYGAVVSLKTGPHQAHAGEFISRGLIPPWTLAVFLVLCFALTLSGVLFLNTLTSPSSRNRETDSAILTANAQTTQQTANASTATAEALSFANASTIQAVTATAEWQQRDDDNDGLSNGQEVLYNTLPDKEDTDEDGLSDGDEINVWKTNPLVADSDGDGLKDGTEIERMIDPLKRDTDEDGLEDAVDPEPGKAMTRTPTNIPLTSTPSPSTTVQPAYADLSITISNGASTLTPGTTAAYTIQVKNSGPNTVYDVRVNDTMPAGLINVSWTCSSSIGSICRAQSGGGNIDARLDLIVNGTATFLVNGTVSPSATGVLVNSATISAPPGVIETNTGNNSASDSDTLTPKVSFAFSISDNRTSIHPGESTSYSIVVINNGPSTATGVKITDYFPSSLTNINWSCSATSGSSCTPTGIQSGNVNVTVNLNPGASASIVVSASVIPSAAGTLSNSASLTSPIDPQANNRSVSDTTVIVPISDLSLNISAPLTASLSSPVTYKLSIKNHGVSNATGVVLVMKLPAEVTFLSSTPGSPACVHSSGTITCSLGNLASGLSVEVEVVAQTPASIGSISAQAEVAANEGDPNPGNNSATAVIQNN